MDETEQQEIIDIATQYFMRETNNDEQKTQQMLSSLANMVQEPGVKLVHIENVLFLIIVRGQGAVEVHTMAKEAIPTDLVRAFKQLAKYLKNIGVKLAYTYTEDRRFAAIARQTRLPVKSQRMDIDGKPMFVYMVTL